MIQATHHSPGQIRLVVVSEVTGYRVQVVVPINLLLRAIRFGLQETRAPRFPR